MSQILDYEWRVSARKNALPCNREVLRKLRLARGWTQAEMAMVAGYSERLVSKAEAGASLALSTIEDLAEALSNDERLVFPEDIVIEPILKTQQILMMIQGCRTMTLDHVEELLNEQIELHLVGFPKYGQFPEISHGRAKVLEVLTQLWIEVGGSQLRLDDIHFLEAVNEVSVWFKAGLKSGSPTEFCGVQICSLLHFHRSKVNEIKLMVDSIVWQHLTGRFR